MNTSNVVLNPSINVSGMPGFLLWARRDAPVLYTALQQRFPEVVTFEDRVRAAQTPGLADLSDVFGSITSALGNAASSIGSFVTQNAQNLLTAASPILVASQQAKIAQAQAQVAIAGRMPAQTGYTVNAQGQRIPVLASQYATQSLISGVPNSVLYIGGGLLLVGGLLLAIRK
jgi:hypothetical protein